MSKRGAYVAAAVMALAVAMAGWLAARKHFSLDEFQYAHAAWLVSRGQLPYRDFFEFHFPFLYQALSGLFAGRAVDPSDIRWLRWPMLGLALLTAGALAKANRALGPWAQVATAVAVLTAPAFIVLGVEVRPDVAAVALFSVALVLLSRGTERERSAWWPLVAGVAAGLAVWSSQKVVLYGAPVAVALAVQRLLGWRCHPDAPARWGLKELRWAAAGVVLVALSVAGYLAVTGSSQAWLQQTVVWARQHEQGYPGFSGWQYLVPALLDAPVFFSLAAVGWVTSAFARRAADAAWLTAWLTTLFSYFYAAAPYPYALLPWAAVSGLLAVRGGAALLSRVPGGNLRAAASALLVAAAVLTQGLALYRAAQPDNREQLSVLAQLGRLTDEGDAVFDCSGSMVARPHAGFRFYTNGLIHQAEATTLGARVAADIRTSQAVAALRDVRFDFLPPDAKAFVRTHFQPYRGDVWLWGQGYDASALDVTFEAVRSDRYFIEPAELSDGRLHIDGQPVTTPVFELRHGVHRVQLEHPPAEWFLLWLPRDGERYRPEQRRNDESFSRLF